MMCLDIYNESDSSRTVGKYKIPNYKIDKDSLQESVGLRMILLRRREIGPFSHSPRYEHLNPTDS